MITKNIKTSKDELKSTVFGLFIVFLIFGAMGFFLLSNINLKDKREGLSLKLQSLRQELQDLEKQNEELKSGINRSDTESFQKEKLYEQGYVEKGAQQVVVVPPEEIKEVKTEEQKNFWQRFFANFKF